MLETKLDEGAIESLLNDENCVKLAVNKTLEHLSVKHLQLLRKHFNKVKKKSVKYFSQIRSVRAIQNIKQELLKRGVS
jgi:hypothetical protein